MDSPGASGTCIWAERILGESHPECGFHQRHNPICDAHRLAIFVRSVSEYRFALALHAPIYIRPPKEGVEVGQFSDEHLHLASHISHATWLRKYFSKGDVVFVKSVWNSLAALLETDLGDLGELIGDGGIRGLQLPVEVLLPDNSVRLLPIGEIVEAYMYDVVLHAWSADKNLADGSNRQRRHFQEYEAVEMQALPQALVTWNMRASQMVFLLEAFVRSASEDNDWPYHDVFEEVSDATGSWKILRNAVTDATVPSQFVASADRIVEETGFIDFIAKASRNFPADVRRLLLETARDSDLIGRDTPRPLFWLY